MVVKENSVSVDSHVFEVQHLFDEHFISEQPRQLAPPPPQQRKTGTI